ncbi:MAG: 50S ribosomal protein L11 methyltransferase [Desulfobacterales bacterium]|nr:50S ribosomal protein L11 methyltransferase [Desulfobacterales bacterium]
MKWVEVSIPYEHQNPALAQDLIANLFFEMGTSGVVVKEPGTDASDGFGEEFQDDPYHAVAGYFPKNEWTGKKIRAFETALTRLKDKVGFKFEIICRQVADEDWENSWKDYFWPEKIGARLVVKPTWRAYAPGKDDIVLEIDPGMAFGTGTHPTTRMCIRMLETYVAPGCSFLDLGTGSGILLIAAGKLGAGRALGVDQDEDAVKIARNNLLHNRLDPERFRVQQGNLVRGLQERFDLIAANIVSQVIVDLLPDIHRVMKDDSIFICSGITGENEDRVLAGMGAARLTVLQKVVTDGWLAFAAGRY